MLQSLRDKWSFPHPYMGPVDHLVYQNGETWSVRKPTVIIGGFGTKGKAIRYLRRGGKAALWERLWWRVKEALA